MKKLLSSILSLLLCVAVNAQSEGQLKEFKNVWSADNGDGTFTNPIINADAPDIDVIRVGDTYYMVTTTMFVFPGATIFKSYDLVNWEYCCNPLKSIDNNDAYNLANGFNHYSQGQWASSLKYHDGKFYLYFIAYGGKGSNDPGRNVLLTATDPEGTWTMKYMDEHYYDAGWMFDDGENGDGYLYVACGIGDIWVNKLNAKTLKKISSTKVFSKESHEGSHMYHIGEWYYIYLTNGGYWRGQTILRSKSPMGPYDECPNGNQQAGSVFSGQGIHQGGLVETQTGEWWTIMFKDAGSIGRIPYLEPVVWKDGWPIIGKNGADVSKNGGKYPKPNVGKEYPKTYLPTNDPFSQTTLGPQWGWNHNPLARCWSLTQRPGWLRLITSYKAANLTQARNTLTQRVLGFSPEGTASSNVKSSYGTAKFDVSGMKDGDICGLCVFQENYGYIGVKMKDGKKYLVQYINNFDGTILKEKEGPELTTDIVYLRAQCRFGQNQAYFFYSLDNEKFIRLGNILDMTYTLRVFTGNKFGLFNYCTKKAGGYVDIDWFTTETGTFVEEDYYTEEYLYPNGKPDAIVAPKAVGNGKTEYYSISGVKLQSPQKGLNIVKHADGKVGKIYY
ncbi:MAG: glycoside hydrolase 43 family protein [Prevotellaceae bacterium]|nr:glycoside hydrolase 43 family protein [Candidatus Minthosoma caballi]